MPTHPPIPPTLTFRSGPNLHLLEPLTDFRQCHGAEPPESRIVYKARLLSPSPHNDDNDTKAEPVECILKIKFQTAAAAAADEDATSHPTASTATHHELAALERFRASSCVHAPHLLAFESRAQEGPEPRNPFPGGYVSYTAMSAVLGKSLFDIGFWSLDEAEREGVRGGFLEALRSVRSLGIEPGDRGLRNVMWDKEARKCGLVDFELWEEFDDKKHCQCGGEREEDDGENDKRELQRWGLAHKPPAKNWWAEFGIHTY